MLLVDTNVWLEIILDQEKAPEAKEFLNSVAPESLAITEFSLDSIGIILVRLKQAEAFEKFLADTIENSRLLKIRLNPEELKLVIKAHKNFNLDFEDSYQYVAAEKYDITSSALTRTLTEPNAEEKRPRIF